MAASRETPGYLRRRLQSLWRRIWPLNRRRAAVLLVAFFAVLFIAFEARATEIISVEVTIIPESSSVGVNPTTERLDFGDMSPGSSQTRHISLENNGLVPTRVAIIILGDVGGFIKLSKNSVTLGRGDATQVDLLLTVPQSASVKRYSGRVLVLRFPWPPGL